MRISSERGDANGTSESARFIHLEETRMDEQRIAWVFSGLCSFRLIFLSFHLTAQKTQSDPLCKIYPCSGWKRHTFIKSDTS